MNIKKLFIPILLLGVIVLNSCKENQLDSGTPEVKFEKSLDDFKTLRKDLSELEDISGMSVAIIRPDTTLVWDFGIANDSSMFRVGSVSKSFAGLSILKLAENGKILLNARLDSLVPELEIENRFEQEHPILVKHIVEASAGFFGFNNQDSSLDPEITEITQAILNNPYKLETAWSPGTFSSYHNLGPVISAYLVEKISKMRYRDFVNEQFFIPMDMKSSTFLLDDNVRNNLVDFSDSTYTHIKLRPSGALNSSTREFVHFLQMLLDRGSYQGKSILSEKSIERFETSTSNLASKNLNIKLGHAVNNWTMYYDGINYNVHGGTMPPNYTNFYAYSAEHKTAFVFMASKTNRVSRKDAAEITQTILPYLQPVINEKPKIEISKEIEDEFLGCYQLVSKSYNGQPDLQIQLVRDSIENLLLIDKNFKLPPHEKILEPTFHDHIYVDRNPLNNSSVSGQSLYALFKNEKGEKFIQKISLSHEGFKNVSCD